ncbi:MAG: hypothetical protein AAF772_19315 [Acidobacteriota bacterium]
MLDPVLLARWDARFRPLLVRLPAPLAVALYARGRRLFHDRFVRARPRPYAPPAALARTVAGVRFRAPLYNAAGLFKDGRGYRLVASQGAGAFLAGTTTSRRRRGNRRAGVRLPFAPYPRSGAASNWLGLPNPGHAAVARRLARIQPVDGCPIGVSLSFDPDIADADARLEALVVGLRSYDAAGVAFVEINESCPNTEDADDASVDALIARVASLGEAFLAHRSRALPVFVKLSCDTPPALLPRLLDALIEAGFDGAVLGNTSTDYSRHRASIEPSERALYDHFSARFGGGVSGRPLAADALRLIETAAEHLARAGDGDGNRPFALVRVGGVATADDLRASLDAGASLAQWYTGLFARFADHGHGLYRHLFSA